MFARTCRLATSRALAEDQFYMRRDQLWFTQKGVDGATQIFPLPDFKTCRGDSFELGYLQGRYGAVPFKDSESPPARSGKVRPSVPRPPEEKALREPKQRFILYRESKNTEPA